MGPQRGRRRTRKRGRRADRRAEGHRVGLPLLRRRLRPGRLHARRRARRHRGQPALADQPGHAVPEGLGLAPARPAARPPDQGPLPRARRDRVGGARARDGDGHDRRARDRRARGRLAGRRRATAGASTARSASPTSAARRSTTRRTTSSRRPSPRWARCRSRTRPAYDTRSTVPGLGTSFGRGGATDFQQDLQNADCILIQGSNMAEAHPVGFRWVMKARERGAKVIHVDPRFGAHERDRPTCTSRSAPAPTSPSSAG